MAESAGSQPESAVARVPFDELMSRGRALFYRLQERDAVEYLRAALDRRPDDLHARYLICLAAQMHSDERTIEQLSVAAQEIDPHDSYALACEAVRFINYANYQRADQYFEQAIGRVPNDVDLWFGRGMLFDYSGDHLKAVNAYLRVLALDRSNVSGHICLGNAYSSIGDFESAYTHYAKAKELAPDTDNAHLRLGRDFFFGGNPGRAILEFRQAIAEEPHVIQGYFFLFAVLRNLHKSDEALDVYSEIRKRFPDHPDLTGVLFEQFGAVQDAVRDYQQVLARNPDDLDTRSSLAKCLKDLRRWEEAIAQYETLIQKEPTNSEAYSDLAGILYSLGRYEAAASAAQKAIDLDRLSGAYTTLADALVMLGRTETATKTLRRRHLIQQQAWAEYQRKYYGGSPKR